jgi:hypothetical protein
VKPESPPLEVAWTCERARNRTIPYSDTADHSPIDTAAEHATVAAGGNAAMSMVQELLRPAAAATGAPAAHKRSLIPRPIIMMLPIIAAAVAVWIGY